MKILYKLAIFGLSNHLECPNMKSNKFMCAPFSSRKKTCCPPFIKGGAPNLKVCPAGMPADKNNIFLRGQRETNHQEAHRIGLIRAGQGSSLLLSIEESGVKDIIIIGLFSDS
jgi:hypothetical protein